MWLSLCRNSECNSLITKIVAHSYIFCSLLIDHQIIAHADNIYNNVINIKPPMVVSREDCESVAEALEQVLVRLEQQT